MLDILNLFYNILADIINMLGSIKIYDDISILSILFIITILSFALLLLRRL